MKKYPEEIIEILKKLSKEANAIIYGGSSIIIRRQLEGKESYRSSKDIDVKSIFVPNKGKKERRGPTSQFKPISIIDEIEKILEGKINGKVQKIENEIESHNRTEYKIEFNDEFEKKNKIKEIIFELYVDTSKNNDEFDMVDGIRLLKIEKIISDKIFASLDNHLRDRTEENNLIRHIVDLMIIPKYFSWVKNDISIELIIKFLRRRMEKEEKWCNRQEENINEGSSDHPIEELENKILLRRSIIENVVESWDGLVEGFVRDEQESLTTINEKLNNNELYNESNIFTNSRLKFIRDILEKYEKI